MTDLIDTAEMYLRTILELEEEGIPVLRARIAERLGHSGPTVSETVSRMGRDGLLSVNDRLIELSEEGRRRAVRVMRKHRLAERLLIDVIGLEYEYVHPEACRWEHVMSDRVERKIIALLQYFDSSPYGNPIPGLDELGVTEAEVIRAGLVPLADVATSETHVVVLRQIAEAAQDDEDALSLLERAGVVPGARIYVRADPADPKQTLVRAVGAGERESISLPREMAQHVYVSVPRPSPQG